MRLICIGILLCFKIFAFDQVIIWGHKLHSHTHSYIHNAFYIAFNHIGYKTYWFDNNDDVSNFDFSNSLFLTEGQVDSGIPIRSDCKYILHNCDCSKYQSLNKINWIVLQVYTDDVLDRAVLKIDTCIYYDFSGRCVYMPWATDLLPHQIEANKSEKLLQNTNRDVCWVGTIGGGRFGNENELITFRKACKKNQCKFYTPSKVSVEENQRLVASSYMAPAIVGTWQASVGYIPCRIFKNISYGKLGITNSERVYELFDKKIVYNPDTNQLFYDAQSKLKTIAIEEIFELMDFVKLKHTYINRIHTLLDFFDQLEKTNVD